MDQQKFYKVLPHKVDESVEEYLSAIEDAYEAEWKFWEQQDGETPLGGSMGKTFVSRRTNTTKDSVVN